MISWNMVAAGAKVVQLTEAHRGYPAVAASSASVASVRRRGAVLAGDGFDHPRRRGGKPGVGRSRAMLSSAGLPSGRPAGSLPAPREARVVRAA